MGRGRNRSLIDRRDEKLLLRYYYWREVRRLRDDDILRIMSEREFFLTPSTIWRVICKKDDGTYARMYAAKSSAQPPVRRRTPSRLVLFEGDDL